MHAVFVNDMTKCTKEEYIYVSQFINKYFVKLSDGNILNDAVFKSVLL